MRKFRIPEIALGFMLAIALCAMFAIFSTPLALQFSTVASRLGPLNCAQKIFGACVVEASPTEQPIFGFAQFVTAFALLMLVYTVSDVRYRFRVAAAPIPLVGLTYIFSALIGLGTLLNSIWFAEGWLLPNFISSQSLWQGFFAVLFFSLAMTWIWYAFIAAPRFGKRNSVNYARALYSYI